jgi:hypothetical protein
MVSVFHKLKPVCVISGLLCDVDDTCALLGITQHRVVVLYRRFGTNRSVPSSRVKKPNKMGPIHCPETSVKDYHSTLRSIPEEGRCDKTNKVPYVRTYVSQRDV